MTEIRIFLVDGYDFTHVSAVEFKDLVQTILHVGFLNDELAVPPESIIRIKNITPNTNQPKET